MPSIHGGDVIDATRLIETVFDRGHSHAWTNRTRLGVGISLSSRSLTADGAIETFPHPGFIRRVCR